MKRFICGFLVVLMLCIQLLLAHHLSEHFDDDDHSDLAAAAIAAAHHDASAQPQPVDDDKDCPICLFSKYLFHAGALGVAAVPVPVTVTLQQPEFALDFWLHETDISAYFSRGPPAPLS